MWAFVAQDQPGPGGPGAHLDQPGGFGDPRAVAMSPSESIAGYQLSLVLRISTAGTVNLRLRGRSANHISLIRHTRPGESRRRTGENRPRIAQVDKCPPRSWRWVSRLLNQIRGRSHPSAIRRSLARSCDGFRV